MSQLPPDLDVSQWAIEVCLLALVVELLGALSDPLALSSASPCMTVHDLLPSSQSGPAPSVTLAARESGMVQQCCVTTTVRGQNLLHKETQTAK